jgi:hypothetical protein
MHKHLTWIAISCSLVAGVFAAEFVSSLGQLPVNGAPAQVNPAQDGNFSSEVAFRQTDEGLDASLQN